MNKREENISKIFNSIRCMDEDTFRHWLVETLYNVDCQINPYPNKEYKVNEPYYIPEHKQ